MVSGSCTTFAHGIHPGSDPDPCYNKHLAFPCSYFFSSPHPKESFLTSEIGKGREQGSSSWEFSFPSIFMDWGLSPSSSRYRLFKTQIANGDFSPNFCVSLHPQKGEDNQCRMLGYRGKWKSHRLKRCINSKSTLIDIFKILSHNICFRQIICSTKYLSSTFQ